MLLKFHRQGHPPTGPLSLSNAASPRPPDSPIHDVSPQTTRLKNGGSSSSRGGGALLGRYVRVLFCSRPSSSTSSTTIPSYLASIIQAQSAHDFHGPHRPRSRPAPASLRPATATPMSQRHLYRQWNSKTMIHLPFVIGRRRDPR